MATESIVAAIATCRDEKMTRAGFTAEQAFSLDEAYSIQSAMAQTREQDGDPIVGYKLGLLSPDKQQQMGVSEPIIGHLHRSMLIDPGHPVVRERFIQPRVEPELAVVFARDIKEGIRRDELLASIDYVMLVVDVLDSIYAGYQFTAMDVVADNASWGGVVLSNTVLPPDVLWSEEDQPISLTVNGTTRRGVLRDIGDPVHWMMWAVERAGRFGRGLQQGDMLLLGSPCAAELLPASGTLVAEGPGDSRIVAPIE